MNANESKAREHAIWTGVAPGWRKHDRRLTEAFRPVSMRMLDLAQVRVGMRVLDIACGTGEPAIPAAERVGTSGQVVATDFVKPMVEFARYKAQASGLTNIEFRVIDGELLDAGENAFDAVTLRWGLMFMPDPVATLTRAHAALVSEGRIALACWAGPDSNAWAAIPLQAIRKYIEVPAPKPGSTGLFAFADASRIREVMTSAGFVDVAVEPFDVVWQGPASGAEYFQEVIELAGPLAALYAKLNDADKRACAADIAQAAEANSFRKPGVALAGMTWIASAKK